MRTVDLFKSQTMMLGDAMEICSPVQGNSLSRMGATLAVGAAATSGRSGVGIAASYLEMLRDGIEAQPFLDSGFFVPDHLSLLLTRNIILQTCSWNFSQSSTLHSLASDCDLRAVKVIAVL